MEIGTAELSLDSMQITEEAREEPEERLLLEVRALFFVHVGEHQNDDGQNLCQIVNLRLVVVHARCIAVILDDVHDQTRHGIQGLESETELSSIDMLDVAVDTRLCADPEEERGHVLRLEYALARELRNVRHERLLRRVRPLIDADPLLEPDKKLLPKRLCLRLD